MYFLLIFWERKYDQRLISFYLLYHPSLKDVDLKVPLSIPSAFNWDTYELCYDAPLFNPFLTWSEYSNKHLEVVDSRLLTTYLSLPPASKVVCYDIRNVLNHESLDGFGIYSYDDSHLYINVTLVTLGTFGSKFFGWLRYFVSPWFYK